MQLLILKDFINYYIGEVEIYSCTKEVGFLIIGLNVEGFNLKLIIMYYLVFLKLIPKTLDVKFIKIAKIYLFSASIL